MSFGCKTFHEGRSSVASEKRDEDWMRREVRKRGGRLVKNIPFESGVPDRFLMHPDGRIILIELKTKDGTLSPIQKSWHRKARLIGHTVVVLYGRDDIRTWLDTVLPEGKWNRGTP